MTLWNRINKETKMLWKQFTYNKISQYCHNFIILIFAHHVLSYVIGIKCIMKVLVENGYFLDFLQSDIYAKI